MSQPKAEEENIIVTFEDDDDKVQKSQVEMDDYKSAENPIQLQEANQSVFPSSEEEITKKKYGGLLPKKPPLISMGHEHAFFDSADWELRKQQGGQKSKGLLEKLRPKLEPTPHQHLGSRRLAYDPPDNGGDSIYAHEAHEEQKRSVDNGNDKDGDHREDQHNDNR